MSHESLSERVALIQSTGATIGSLSMEPGPPGRRVPAAKNRSAVPACRPRSDFRGIPHSLEWNGDHV